MKCDHSDFNVNYSVDYMFYQYFAILDSIPYTPIIIIP